MKTILLFIGSRPTRPPENPITNGEIWSTESLIFYGIFTFVILGYIAFDYLLQRKQSKRDETDQMLDKIQRVGADVEEFLDFFKKQKKILENIQKDLVKMEEKKKDLKTILKDDGSAVRALLNVQKRSKYVGYAIAFLIGILSKFAYDLIIYLFS